MRNSGNLIAFLTLALCTTLPIQGCKGTLCPSENADRILHSFVSDPGKGDQEVFAACLDAGANPNALFEAETDPAGWTPLLLTAFGNAGDASRQPSDRIWNASSMEQVRLLLAHGADLKAKTPKGENALYLASVAGRVPLMEFFLAKGLPVNMRTNEGKTPLYGALLYGRKDVVSLLLEKGADPNVISKENQSILDFAIVVADQIEREGIRPTKEYDPRGVVEILKNHGAKSANDLNQKP